MTVKVLIRQENRQIDRCEDDETNRMCRCQAQVEQMDADARNYVR